MTGTIRHPWRSGGAHAHHGAAGPAVEGTATGAGAATTQEGSDVASDRWMEDPSNCGRWMVNGFNGFTMV